MKFFWDLFKVLVFNYLNDVYISNLTKKIKLLELEEESIVDLKIYMLRLLNI